MALDNAQNFADDTLASGVTAGDTTITVNDASAFPATPFRITVWDNANYDAPGKDPDAEIMKVTGVSSNDLTVERGKENTSDVGHGSGDLVENNLTADMIDQIETDINNAGGGGGQSPYFAVVTTGSELETAISDAKNASGGTIKLKQGTFTLSGNISTTPQIQLVGDGIGDATVGSRIDANGNNIELGGMARQVDFENLGSGFGNGLIMTDKESALDYCRIAGRIQVDGDNCKITNCWLAGYSVSSAYLYGDRRFQLTNCFINEFDGEMRSGRRQMITNNNIEGGTWEVGSESVWVGNTVPSVTEFNLVFADNVQFIGNELTYNTHAISIDGDSSAVIITNNSFDDAGGSEAILLESGADQILIKNNDVKRAGTVVTDNGATNVIQKDNFG